jgi:hypothetical protein
LEASILELGDRVDQLHRNPFTRSRVRRLWEKVWVFSFKKGGKNNGNLSL